MINLSGLSSSTTRGGVLTLLATHAGKVIRTKEKTLKRQPVKRSLHHEEISSSGTLLSDTMDQPLSKE